MDSLIDQIEQWRKHPERFANEYLGIRVARAQRNTMYALAIAVLFPGTKIILSDKNFKIWEHLVSQSNRLKEEIEGCDGRADGTETKFKNGSYVLRQTESDV